MKVQTATRAIQLQEWSAQINERLQSGQTVKAWCAAQGIALKTYYYRLRRVREELLEAAETSGALAVSGTPRFAALPIQRSSGAAVTVRMGNYSVEIQNGADGAVVEQALQALSRCRQRSDLCSAIGRL